MMKPGDVRVFEKGNKAIVLAVGLWAEQQGNQLHIHISGLKHQVTVTNDKDSIRYHRVLFRSLRRVLIANDRWPFGDEGAETETR